MKKYRWRIGIFLFIVVSLLYDKYVLEPRQESYKTIGDLGMGEPRDTPNINYDSFIKPRDIPKDTTPWVNINLR